MARPGPWGEGEHERSHERGTGRRGQAGDDPAWTPREAWPVTRRLRRRRPERADRIRPQLTGLQRLLILDSWLRSKLPAHD